MKPPVLTLAALSVLVVATVSYTYEGMLNELPTPAEVASLHQLPYVYLVVLLTSVGLVAFDAARVAAGRVRTLNERGTVPLGPTWIIPYVLSRSRYRWVFLAATVSYGLLYSFLTSLVVYRPSIDFAQNPGVPIPSAVTVQLFGTPFYVPEIAVFVTNHLALILIPLTIVLLVSVSALVGLNFALSAFAFDNRARNGGRSWLGGLGAVVGLFTGCSTCAGLFFASVLGGAGAMSFAVLLQYYQPVFIALSIPVLLVTPFLVSRSLSRVFEEGCVVIRLKREESKPSQSGYHLS